MIDTSAAGRGEAQSIEDLAREWVPTGLIGHVHVNDSNRRGPGQGKDAFAGFLRALADTGYAGGIGVEPFDYHPDPQTCAARAIGFLRGIEEAMIMADRFNVRIEDVRLFERDVVFRMPFRFGVVTLEAAPQAFAHVRVRTAAGEEAWGAAAETMAPKWFDKNLELTNEENFEQLRQSLRTARKLYLEGREPASPFALHARSHDEQVRRCGDIGLNPLIAQYGPALIDRAIIDAACRGAGRELLRGDAGQSVRHRAGRTRAGPRRLRCGRFLARLRPRDHIHARHTVGMVDPLTDADIAAGKRVGDGLPETLEEVIDAYGHTYFKLKVGGDLTADLDRLVAIARVIDSRCDSYRVTLDGNEQYGDVEGIVELWEAMALDQRLAKLQGSVLFVEQPIRREARHGP
jgi:hypothetical protein